MSRLVEAVPVGTTNTWKVDLQLYAERVAKYVPAEVIALYTSIVLAYSTSTDAALRLRASTIVWFAGIVITWLLLGRLSNEAATKTRNQLIGTVAFLVWSYGYPKGMFVERGWYDEITGAVVVAVWTFAIGLYQPTKPA